MRGIQAVFRRWKTISKMEPTASPPAERLTGKTALCKHRDTCLINALKGFARGAGIGAALSSAFFLLSAIASGKLFRNPAMLRKLVSEDFFRYATFLSVMSGGYRAVLCAMRRCTADERVSSWVAGLCCSVGLMAMKGETKKTWALYLFVRAVVSVHSSSVQKGVIPDVPYGVFILFALVCAVLLYARAFEPTTLSRSYYNFISYMTAGTKNDTKMLEVFSDFYQRRAAQSSK